MEGKPSIYNYVYYDKRLDVFPGRGGAGGEECTPLNAPQVSGLI